jgi:enoyl-CoA hydratase/carnithine racemase
MGLASRAVPAAEVLPIALALARDVAVHAAPLSVAITKRLLWASPPLDAEAADRLESAMHRHVMGRADAGEGVLAYLERREPRWSASVTRDWPEAW